MEQQEGIYEAVLPPGGQNQTDNTSGVKKSLINKINTTWTQKNSTDKETVFILKFIKNEK